MAKYRKRTPEVEAFRWDGGKELWPMANGFPGWIRKVWRDEKNRMVIERFFDSPLIVEAGEWVVFDEEGDSAMFSDDEFAATYESVEDDFTPPPIPVQHGKTTARQTGRYEPKIRMEGDETDG